MYISVLRILQSLLSWYEWPLLGFALLLMRNADSASHGEREDPIARLSHQDTKWTELSTYVCLCANVSLL